MNELDSLTGIDVVFKLFLPKKMNMDYYDVLHIVSKN